MVLNEDETKMIMGWIVDLVKSPNTAKYQEIVNRLNDGYGQLLVESNVSDTYICMIRKLHLTESRQALYVWQNIYHYLCNEENKLDKRLQFGSLYFYIAEAFYYAKNSGYGRFYLKAYVEDLAFHGNPERGGAIQQLIALCGLGTKGIELIQKELMVLTKTDSLQDLSNHLKSITRSEFETLTIDLENRFDLESHGDFFFPFESLKEGISIIEPISKKKLSRDNYILLEKLCQLLFGSIPGFRYKFDERSQLFQLDGFIINNSKNQILMDLGKNIIIEAKQYFHRNVIDRKIIDILAMNLIRCDAQSAFLVTTASLTRTAAEEIYNTYVRTGKYVIFLNLKDLKDIAEQKITFTILLAKKISDIRTKRMII